MRVTAVLLKHRISYLVLCTDLYQDCKAQFCHDRLLAHCPEALSCPYGGLDGSAWMLGSSLDSEVKVQLALRTCDVRSHVVQLASFQMLVQCRTFSGLLDYCASEGC